MLVSIIIPCFQNEHQLSSTVKRTINSLKDETCDMEILLIDDGATDGTWTEIQKLSQQFETILGIKLRYNVGAYNAILAGFARAKGEALLVMAADGDDPPELIPDLLAHYPNHDVVLANRSNSDKGFGSTLTSSIVYMVFRTVGAKHIPKGGSDFLLVRRELVDNCLSQGFRSGNTLIQLVQQATRVYTIGYTKGRSKPTSWSFGKKMKLFLETLNQFIPIPFVRSNPINFEVETTTDR